MKLYNTKDLALAFTVRGVHYTAPPHGLVTPEIPDKLVDLVTIRGVPLSPTAPATPAATAPAAAPAPPAPPPAPHPTASPPETAREAAERARAASAAAQGGHPVSS